MLYNRLRNGIDKQTRLARRLLKPRVILPFAAEIVVADLSNLLVNACAAYRLLHAQLPTLENFSMARVYKSLDAPGTFYDLSYSMALGALELLYKKRRDVTGPSPLDRAFTKGALRLRNAIALGVAAHAYVTNELPGHVPHTGRLGLLKDSQVMEAARLVALAGNHMFSLAPTMDATRGACVVCSARARTLCDTCPGFAFCERVPQFLPAMAEQCAPMFQLWIDRDGLDLRNSSCFQLYHACPTLAELFAMTKTVRERQSEERRTAKAARTAAGTAARVGGQQQAPVVTPLGNLAGLAAAAAAVADGVVPVPVAIPLVLVPQPLALP
ncbi:MAG: hypothetical protein ACOVOD_08835, partial [Rhodoferax sp.]